MKRDSFSKNLYIYVLLSLLIPITLLALLLTVDEYKYFTHLRDGVFDEHLQKQTQHVAEWSRYKSNLLEKSKLVFEENLQQGTSVEGLKSLLDRIDQIDGDILNSYYTDEEGLNLVSGGRGARVDGRTRDWYKGAMAEGSYISLPYKDALTGLQVLTYSVAIEDVSGQRLGVLGIDIQFSDLMEILQKNVKNINGRLILLDGFTVIDSDIHFVPDDVIEKFSKEKMTRKYFRDGKLYYIKAIGVRNYQAIYIIDADAFMKGYFSKENDSLFRFIAATIVMLFLAVFMINKATRPFKGLHGRVRDLVSSNNIQIDDMKDPDLRLVFEQFTKFNKHMMMHIDTLKHMNAELDEEKMILQRNHVALNKAVNDLHEANLQLKEKDELYRNVLENISDLIWVIDDDGIISFVGKTLLETLKHSEKEVIGKPIGWLFGMTGQDGAELFELLKKRDFDGMELQLVGDLNTRQRIVSTRTTRQFINGDFKSILGISRDISDEKKTSIDYFYKNREMFVINEVNKAMTSSGNDLQIVLKAITEKINHLMNISFSTIRIKKEDKLDLAAVSGVIYRYIYADSIPIKGSHLGLALLDKHMVNIKGKHDLHFNEPLLEEALETMQNIIFIPLLNKDNSFGVLTVGSRKALDDDKLSILEYLAQSASIAIEKSIIYEQLKNNYLKTIEALANALEEKLYNMHGHTMRVSRFAVCIAEKLFLKQSQVDSVHIAGLLHDIGKIGINDEYLRHVDDASNLIDDDIRRIMACHPVIGKKILRPIGLNEEILDGIYYHHKRYDLSGYPDDMINEQPLMAQIIQMSDALDNLIQHDQNPSEESLRTLIPKLREESGKRFGPEIVDAVIELIEEQPEVLVAIIECHD